MLIPGAYEPRGRSQRNTAVAPGGSDGPPAGTRPSPRPAAERYVVAAPSQPTSWLGQSAMVLADLAVVTAIVFAIAAVPMVIARIIGWAQ